MDFIFYFFIFLCSHRQIPDNSLVRQLGLEREDEKQTILNFTRRDAKLASSAPGWAKGLAEIKCVASGCLSAACKLLKMPLTCSCSPAVLSYKPGSTKMSPKNNGRGISILPDSTCVQELAFPSRERIPPGNA